MGPALCVVDEHMIHSTVNVSSAAFPTHSCRFVVLAAKVSKDKEKGQIMAIPVAGLSWVTNPPKRSVVE